MTPVLTISTHVPVEPYYHYHEFVRSCQKQGVNPVFLPTDTWRGLCSKPKILQAYLEKEGANFKTMIFCDSWDVVLVDSVDRIMHEFDEFGKPIVFNAERNCFPRSDLANMFPTSLTPYRFLNSGFIVGYTDAIMQMLDDMKAKEIPDDYQRADGSWQNTNDQELFSLWYLAHQQKAALDYNARICQTLHAAEPEEFSLDGGKVKSNITGNFPCAFHGNGGGKAWLETIMRWLNV